MSSETRPIYTEKTKCRDCYKCVRNCPVKAIKVEDNSASIIHELCIYCGNCVHVCPAQAKKVRSDVEKVKALLLSGRRVILSLAPSWTSGIFGSEEEMLGTFAALGFSGISETALGAEIITGRTASALERSDGLTVSSACPSIVELFRKYYPEDMGALSDLPSPLEAHGHFLKKLYGEETAVVFAGPCIAKKLEADRAGSPIDIALTFDELNQWIADGKIGSQQPGLSFQPRRASSGSLYALEGGMISSFSSLPQREKRMMVSLSGVNYIRETLEDLDPEENMLLELLSCPGGCVNGSGFNCGNHQLSFRKKSLEHYRDVTKNAHMEPPADFPDLPFRTYEAASPPMEMDFSDDEIERSLAELGKVSAEDRLDCGGCGYNSCRDFAAACLSGMGEKQMCVTNMRKRAQKKMDMLLRTLPMGVAIVNRQRKIVQCNCEFTALFAAPGYECDEDYVRNHIDLPLKNFIDLSAHVDSILGGEELLFNERIKFGGKFLKVTFFSIERGGLAGIIFQDITSTSVKREDVIRKAEEVINKNLQNVQQIASLLGENAAETEIILRSLADQFKFSTAGAET